MMHAASVFLRGSKFDTFLFAPIGEDRNGMQLSVLSALARRDIDPWQEAAELARLPGKTATERLALLIAPLPDGPSSQLDPGTVAGRLIEHLPGRASSNVSPRKTFLRIRAVTKSPTVAEMIFVFIVFVMVSLLSVKCITMNCQSPAHVDNTHTPASNTISPEVPVPSFSCGY
jgi:hypothetical protein